MTTSVVIFMHCSHVISAQNTRLFLLADTVSLGRPFCAWLSHKSAPPFFFFFFFCASVVWLLCLLRHALFQDPSHGCPHGETGGLFSAPSM